MTSDKNLAEDILQDAFIKAFTGIKKLAVGGGVINNEALRGRLTEHCKNGGVELFLPPKEYCADNAAMVASFGETLYNKGERSDLFLNAKPGGF